MAAPKLDTATNIFNKNTHPNCHAGYQYALDVVNKKIPACIYVIGACKRAIKEINNQYHPDWVFSPERAEKYLRVVQRFHHVTGNWPVPNIIYEPWQCFIWMNIQGFVNRETRLRRFRYAHVEVPRGNAKSTMASQFLLYELCLDNPNGNMVSTVASKKDQAMIVLEDARKMARKNKGFLKKTGVEVRAKEILHAKSNSRARAMSSDADGLDGLNDIAAVCDELHAMSREVFGTITSGMSKRKDSLVLAITTAGNNTDSVGFEESIHAKKICLGEHEDDTRFAIVYTVDPDDDIFVESTWRKANPNWGVSVDAISFKSKMMKAKEVAADLPNLKIKHLNMWTEGEESFFSVDRWDLCANKNLKWDDFHGKTCMAGIDLSQVTDLSAKIFIFKDEKTGKYILMDKVYVSEEAVGSKNSSDKYPAWIEDGWLIQMPGAVIDYIQFGEELKEDADTFNIRQCAYDPWNATEMSQRMGEYIEMVEFRQNTGNFSEPMKTLDALIRQQKIEHRGSPLMRWALANVVSKEDANGNVFPKKPKKDRKMKIDPIVASIMALALWLQDTETESIYESHGIRSF